MSLCGPCPTDTGYSPLARFYEDVNEYSSFIKGGRFLQHLNDYQLLKKKSEPVYMSA